MSYFTTRKAMTTAEPLELLIFQHSEIIFLTTSSADCQPGGEAFLFILCILWTNDEHWCPLVSISV